MSSRQELGAPPLSLSRQSFRETVDLVRMASSAIGVGTWPFAVRPVRDAATMDAPSLDASLLSALGGESSAALQRRCDVTNTTLRVLQAIRHAEHDRDVHSVGDFSWPNAAGQLQLDAALIEMRPLTQRLDGAMDTEMDVRHGA